MIRTFRIRTPFDFSRIFRKCISTTPLVSFPESHGLLPTSQSPITPKPYFFNAVTADGKQLPTYRIIDGIGNVIEGAELPEVCPCCSMLSWTSAYDCGASLMNNWRAECP
jgi:2-oxoisovalerate dehydrogenase E1 component alpha subunit